MKKSITIILILALTVTVFAGCRSKNDQIMTTPTVTMPSAAPTIEPTAPSATHAPTEVTKQTESTQSSVGEAIPEEGTVLTPDPDTTGRRRTGK